MTPEKRSVWIKEQARALGFLDCRIAKADFLEEEAPLFEKWLNKGFQGQMAWLEDHFDLRMDPRKLVPGARSVISLMYNYFPEEQSLQESAPKIARYALGRDYHKVLRKKMKQLMRSAHEQWGEVGGRAFVDSGPVHERAWARRSGLGWVGKNSLLLNKQHGSYFFLCELILDVEIAADDPVTDHCGSCTRCIDACPTDAIVADQVIDSQKCISYLTIELKEAIPEEFSSQLNGWAFGCDICQEVCPWNRFSSPHTEPDFHPRSEMGSLDQKQWLEITEDLFGSYFGNTPLKRAGFDRFKANIQRAVDSEKIQKDK